MEDNYILVNEQKKKFYIEDSLIKIEGSIVDIPINKLGLIGIMAIGVVYQETEDSEEIIIKEGIEPIIEMIKNGLEKNGEI